MLYVKNVPGWERWFRVMMGIGLVVGSVLWLGPNAKGWALGAVGLTASMTGLVGWCPMCAVVGRKPAKGK